VKLLAVSLLSFNAVGGAGVGPGLGVGVGGGVTVEVAVGRSWNPKNRALRERIFLLRPRYFPRPILFQALFLEFCSRRIALIVCAPATLA
jgi:hypothetical protein